ncbi:MAG: molybdate ABC transporter permease subunit [Campylobacter sp.]|nr:molybdate ABC transporter permease subunit [Campylobacter sp.]
MQDISFEPFYISIKLSIITTTILFALVLPLSWAVATKNFRGKALIETICSLPLVLPPSVMGFYLLVFLSPYSFFGAFMEEHFGIRLVFNFTGLVIASCVYSLPFMFSPLVAGFKSMPKNLILASYSLGKSKLITLFRVSLPAIKPSLLTALVVSFAHTMGEFGVVLMIGGSVSDETRVASIAIYEAVEMLEFDKAHIYSGIMLVISFVVLFVVHAFGNKKI